MSAGCVCCEVGTFAHSRMKAEKPIHEMGVHKSRACHVLMGVEELSKATNTKAAVKANSVTRTIPARRYFNFHLTVIQLVSTSLPCRGLGIPPVRNYSIRWSV